MTEKMRRNFANPCSARDTNLGTWRVDCGASPQAHIIIRGADSRALAACGATFNEVGVEWQPRRVLLSMLAKGRVATVEAAAVIVHEPAADLYAALPLADFDARAQRFWRRVFLLVRIPGGRSLLGILTRLSRKSP
jgi:hypothetical protein